MTTYSPQEKEEFKSLIGRLLLFAPQSSLRKIQARLQEMSPPVELSLPYLMNLTNEIRAERAARYTNETKEMAVAQFEDMIDFVVNQLRAIAQEEKLVYSRTDEKGKPGEKLESRIFAQDNRIKALMGIITAYEKLNNLKMDLGLFERKLGTVEGDVRIMSMMAAIKQLRNGKPGDITEPVALPGGDIAASGQGD